MTVRELRAHLLELSASDLEREVHVVFHGNTRPSFNLPAVAAYTGANADDFLVIVNEPRGA